MEKQELRARMRQRKRALTAAQIELASAQLARQLYALPVWKNAKSVYVYLSYNQEVRTLPIVRQALLEGKQVAAPKVVGDELRFVVLTDPAQTGAGYRGIPEPLGDEPAASDPRALVLLPGLAFDPEGNRVGYGGGFYDRFLHREPNHPTVALCYDFQLLSHIEAEALDVPADTVLWAAT